MTDMVKAGDRVYLKPEWCEKGEENTPFYACHDQTADSDRILITWHMDGWRIQPTQIVRLDMLNTSKA